MTEPEPEPEQAKRKRTVLIVVGSIVVLAVIGLVIFLVSGSDSEDSADPGVPTISGEAPPAPTSRQTPPSEPVASGSAEVPGPPPPANEEVAAARTVVEDAISAINAQDVGAMEQLACDPAAIGQPDDLQPGVTAVLTENPEVTGDKATAQVELSIEGGTEPTVVPLPLQRRDDGTWCVP